MQIRSTEYIKSCTSYKDKPKGHYPEFAFIGRSNVGKSSLINMLVNRKNLAKTSSRPGKTQTLNYFLINKQWYLVDLPGYGFAKVSLEIRKKWEKIIRDYILNDILLINVFMLIDARLPLQQSDMDFMLFLGQYKIPFVILSTKTDKAKTQELGEHLNSLYSFIDSYWETRPIHILTSAREKRGRNEILNIIEQALITFKNQTD